MYRLSVRKTFGALSGYGLTGFATDIPVPAKIGEEDYIKTLDWQTPRIMGLN